MKAWLCESILKFFLVRSYPFRQITYLIQNWLHLKTRITVSVFPQIQSAFAPLQSILPWRVVANIASKQLLGHLRSTGKISGSDWMHSQAALNVFWELPKKKEIINPKPPENPWKNLKPETWKQIANRPFVTPDKGKSRSLPGASTQQLFSVHPVSPMRFPGKPG